MTGVLSGAARWHVEHGDCLDVLRSLPDASVDAVVTDPPYGTTQNKWDTPFDLVAWWAQIERVAKRNAAIVLFAQTPFDKVLGASRLDLLRYEWIWEKGKATGFLNAKVAPLKAHENILVFYRSAPTYNPQKHAAERPTDGKPRHHKPGASGSNYNFAASAEPWREDGTRYPRTVLRFPSVAGQNTVHPTQKPADLLAYLCRTYCAPGAVVLDPFTGSGTTGVACMREGFRFIGIEREAEYVEIARARIAGADAPAQLALAGGA